MERSSFEILAELFARDIDPELVRRGLAKTPTERIVWLEEMQTFAAAAKKGRSAEAERIIREAL